MTDFTERERLVAAHLFKALEPLLQPAPPAQAEAPKRRRRHRRTAEVQAQPKRRGRPPKVRIVPRGVSGRDERTDDLP